MAKSLLLCALLLPAVDAHGRMTRLRSGAQTVFTRKGPGYENNPTGSGAKFVCQNAKKAPYVDIVAGSTIEIEWDFSAAHKGDCALYISYDDTKFFKIANFPECNNDNRKFVPVKIPKWLPNGVVVVRWDWYALHQWPSAELYAQCTDATIKGSDGSATVADLAALSYTVINPAIYPSRSGAGAMQYVRSLARSLARRDSCFLALLIAHSLTHLLIHSLTRSLLYLLQTHPPGTATPSTRAPTPSS